jgi:LSD1 subclass zinc finger protein
MGLYPIDCAVCKKPFMWFSGCLDQRCSDCQNAIKKEEPKKMKKVELEKELLELKAKVIALEARPICYGHVCGCNHYNYPQYPGYYPTYVSPIVS